MPSSASFNSLKARFSVESTLSFGTLSSHDSIHPPSGPSVGFAL